jgi:hypothetical protein
MASPVKDKKPAPLPAPNSDFDGLSETLPAEELAVLKFDTDQFMTLGLLINASVQTATRFFSAGNFRMRLAAHLL